MGRGRSGSSGSGGSTSGGVAGNLASGGALPQASQFLQPPSPQDVAKGNILPKGGVPFSDFKGMTDDEKADVVSDALKTGVPLFLDDSGLQRFAYFTGMSNKPKVVSDDTLDNTKGKELYRTIGDAYNRTTDIGYTSTDIAKQISTGDFTMYSDSGGSAHGKAIYFADTLGGSLAYKSGRKSDITMRAKITGGKEISESSLNTKFRTALRNGDKLAMACNAADSASARNLYGLAKGYTHMTDSYGYYMIFDRSCLTISDTHKNSNSLSQKGRW